MQNSGIGLGTGVAVVEEPAFWHTETRNTQLDQPLSILHLEPNKFSSFHMETVYETEIFY
jgi:hypothetical protein